MDFSLLPIDILCTIPIISPREYKAMIATCRLWHATLLSRDYVNRRADPLSSAIMLHSELDWRIGLQKLVDHLHQDVILRYESQLNIARLSSNPKLSRDFIRLNFMQFDNDIYANPLFDDELIREFLREMDNSYSEYRNKQNWKKLSANPNLTIAFIDEHFDKLDNTILSSNRALSREYILNNAHRHYLNSLRLNPNIDLTQLFIIATYDLNHIDYIMGHPDLTIEFCEEHDLEPWRSYRFRYNTGSMMTPEFIRKCWNDINHSDLWANPRFTVNLIEELIVPRFVNLGEIHFGWLLDNPSLTPEFMLRHIARFSTTPEHLIKMATHPNATLDFIEVILPYFKGLLYS